MKQEKALQCGEAQAMHIFENIYHIGENFKVHLTCPHIASRHPVVNKCFKVFMSQTGFHLLYVSQGTNQGYGLWEGV